MTSLPFCPMSSFGDIIGMDVTLVDMEPAKRSVEPLLPALMVSEVERDVLLDGDDNDGLPLFVFAKGSVRLVVDMALPAPARNFGTSRVLSASEELAVASMDRKGTSSLVIITTLDFWRAFSKGSSLRNIPGAEFRRRLLNDGMEVKRADEGIRLLPLKDLGCEFKLGGPRIDWLSRTIDEGFPCDCTEDRLAVEVDGFRMLEGFCEDWND